MLEDLKERLREQFLALIGRVRDSEAWNSFVEKYQDLSPTGQILVKSMSGLFVVILLLMLPYSFFSSSQETMDELESKKALMRDMFRVSRAAAIIPPFQNSIEVGQLMAAVENVLATERPLVLPEQRQPLTEFNNDRASDSALPKGLKQKGIVVNLTRLNVDQIVKIGSRFHTLHPAAKVTGVKIQATPTDPHFFDVTFKIVGFSAPTIETSQPESKKRFKGINRSRDEESED